ncbi:hypothetical protein [Pseudacidovorax intermedius]|uniref:Uncharacterized protein n=1 Tax=Pseudacidovorax intermedius TaxID=433924 RepID=A0A147GWG2_9BURK|nr:hypothetical protein [Pseudacidovorax intermedius]KTT21893.1 hypothetical protein NS331_11055 [Pseudacidovorax intermedius]
MTFEEQTLLIIKGSIADLPEAERQRVETAERHIRALIQQDKGAAVMAMALIGAELDAGR